MRNQACWLLIGAVALGASLAGHSIQLSIEATRVLGSAPAPYIHSLQTPGVFIVFSALVLSALLIARGILLRFRDQSGDADWLVPALDDISRITPARLVALIVALEFALLIAGELVEQSLSSYDSIGLGAIFGPGHFTAPFVYAAVGALAAWLLIAFAHAVQARAADLAKFVRSVIALLLLPGRVRCAPALRLLALRRQSLAPPLLARHIASRPPPAPAILVA